MKMILTGKNLGARQRELNSMVKEAAENKIDFNTVKAESENSDIDQFFNIDLAIKLKNVDYIVEILKCGDRLHISRALKALWLYNDEYLHIVNPHYLKDNIFPFMSLKMKNIVLGKISCNLQNGNRAIEFYKYCIEENLKEISFKFLLITPQSFKLQYINEDDNEEGVLENFVIYDDKELYLRHFIQNSFTIAEVLIQKTFKHRKNHALYLIRHMYSVSDVKYLDLVEKYASYESGQCTKVLGLRISKNIMQKYKSRVLEKPLVYIALLNKDIIAKYSNSDNAKLYLSVLIPEKSKAFWDMNFCDKYKFIIDVIPFAERFQIVKNMFRNAYPEEEFETHINFAEYKYYDLMTSDARDNWALSYIKHEEKKGSWDFFKWYAHVNFAKAFHEIKKLVMITTKREIRCDIVKVLIESAKTQRDLEILFKYYYERHVNENVHEKHSFLNNVIDNHDVLNFDESCWTAFHNILLSLNIYNETISNNTAQYYRQNEQKYAIISLLYHIIHGIEIDQKLKLILKNSKNCYNLKHNYYTSNMLNPEMQDIVFKYLVDYYVNEIKKLDAQTNNDEIKPNLRSNIASVLNILVDFEKTKDQCPEIVMKYVKQDWESFETNSLFRVYTEELTQERIIRDLKKDTKLVIDGLPLVKETIKQSRYPVLYLNKLVRKLKIYFSNDIAKLYLQIFKDILADKTTGRRTNIAVFGIFHLADSTFKIDFMAKHAPVEPKINYEKIDRSLLEIQEMICRFACYSRPPVPLDSMMMFVKGDYVHYSLPMFNMYMANLPLPLCIQFILRILDAPVSIRKHGIRLAFRCFSSDIVRKLTLDIWKRTKNISIRTIIYRGLFDKFLSEKETGRKVLFEALNLFTRDLNEDDDDEVFELLTSYKMPDVFVSEYIEAGWFVVSKLPSKAKNINRISDMIYHIKFKMELLNKSVVRPIIDEHIKIMLVQKQIRSKCDIDELDKLNTLKFILTAKYIVDNDDHNENLELLRHITMLCFKMWNEVDCLNYTFRNFYSEFTSYLRNEYTVKETKKCIFETLLKDIEESLPLHQRYLHVWDFRLDIVNFDILSKYSNKIQEQTNLDAKKILLKESISMFGREIGNMVKEFVEKGLYFRYLSQSIIDTIDEKLTIHFAYWADNNADFIDTHIFTALALTEIELSETYFIALQILPSNYEGMYQEEHKCAIEKIRAFKNNEIQCCFNEKFVYIMGEPNIGHVIV